MNSIIETLNHWGEGVVSLAWPMLWQSSLLIVALFALDFALRRKVRAAIRYALWLVVLVKLLLPPSLALPTGVGWWLRSPAPPPPKPPAHAFVVTYGNAVVPNLSLPRTPPVFVPPPRPPMSAAAWTLVACGGISAGLLAWLLIRWGQVAQKVRRATVPEKLTAVSDEARDLAGLRSAIRLKLTDGAMSPAVCGLFRPVILLPKSLVEKLSPEQLGAVLLHELIHLRRGDVWLNCLQALLQIVYWWHPLLWLANARIRRVREEAVDDAVMLALADDAETYAPTLLEVAKLAFNRPLASLGLVGILESRSALRQRIERLVNFRPPRKAGLTVVSVFGILAFTALAVPMGEAPQKSVESVAFAPANPDLAKSESFNRAPAKLTLENPVDTNDWKPGYNMENVVGVAIKVDEKGGYWVGTNQFELARLRNLLLEKKQNDTSFLVEIVNTNAPTDGNFSLGAAVQLAELCKELNLSFVSPQVVHITTNAPPVVGPNTNLYTRVFKIDMRAFYQRAGINPDDPATRDWSSIRSFIAQSGVDLTPPKSVFFHARDGQLLVRATKQDLDRIERAVEILNGETNAVAKASPTVLEPTAPAPVSGSYTNLTIRGEGRQAIVSKLNRIYLRSVQYDNVPLSEVIRNLSEDVKNHDPEKAGINFILNPEAPPVGALDIRSIAIKIDPALTDVRLADLLDIIVKAAGRPIKYSITDNGIIFSLRAPDAEPLYLRTFKVDPNTFHQGLESVGAFDFSTNSTEATTFPSRNSVSAAVRNFFTSLGVNFSQPGTSVFWSDRKGELLVRATLTDLDIIEKAIEVLNYHEPQVNIKVTFVEVLDNGAGSLFLGNIHVTNISAMTDREASPGNPSGAFPGAVAGSAASTNSSLIGILTAPQFKAVLETLQQRNDTDFLNESDITTLSGRQVHIEIADLETIVTGQTNVVTNGKTNANYHTEQFPFGPSLDVIPYVSTNGYSIRMTILASLTEFLGYTDPGPSERASVVKPHIRLQQFTNSVIVWDGQTAVLGGLSEASSTNSVQKNLIIFVTPTIIDPAGNRVHSDDENLAPNHK
jgi:beta-lactamase regulating signal transducer with metallopeptidase domain/transcriptional/translational regulatory protein YebC/TACO1